MNFYDNIYKKLKIEINIFFIFMLILNFYIKIYINFLKN